MKKYDENYIKSYFKTLGDVKYFYIVELAGPSSKVIVYVDNNDEQWCLMEEDDQLVDDCYEYLKSVDTKVITTTEERKKFEQENNLK